jgi:SAM-dependent methyltransferase
VDFKTMTSIRKDALCPKCNSRERHRLQKLVLDLISSRYDFSEMKILHFAPEAWFRQHFRTIFKEYTTADISMKNIDMKVDLRRLPIKDAQYDVVYASHVLEHIKDDREAISEIRRVLRPNGIAILPVPYTGEKTVEYQEPDPLDSGHIRAPGLDYYDRYRDYFSSIELYSSRDFPSVYQLYIYEDKNYLRTNELPLQQTMAAKKLIDIVPVCLV